MPVGSGARCKRDVGDGGFLLVVDQVEIDVTGERSGGFSNRFFAFGSPEDDRGRHRGGVQATEFQLQSSSPQVELGMLIMKGRV